MRFEESPVLQSSEFSRNLLAIGKIRNKLDVHFFIGFLNGFVNIVDQERYHILDSSKYQNYVLILLHYQSDEEAILMMSKCGVTRFPQGLLVLYFAK